MTSQPEKLFRDKLENFQRPAPEAAWERIEAGLNKRDNKFLWLKVAAAILVLVVAGFILWPDEQVVNNSITNAGKQDEPAQSLHPKKTVTATPETPVQKKADKKSNRVNTVKQQQTASPVTEPLSEKDFTVAALENTEMPETIPTETTAEIITSQTIVYTAEEVNAKFLRKKLPVEATSEEKKSSGIQKLMGLAYDLKNNENGYGNLRQMKDEILALNFLNNNEDKTEKRKN
ncbi:MAG: hypothetical protein WAZ98_02610 [Cyclobacteriaceae bacterium]